MILLFLALLAVSGSTNLIMKYRHAGATGQQVYPRIEIQRNSPKKQRAEASVETQQTQQPKGRRKRDIRIQNYLKKAQRREADIHSGE